MKVILLPTEPKINIDRLICAVDEVGYESKPTGEETKGIRNRLAGTAAHTTIDIKKLSELISHGHTIQGAQLRDKLDESDEERNTDNRFERQQLFVVDVDNDEKRADGKKYRRADYIKNIHEIADISARAGLRPCIIAESYSCGKTDPNGDEIPKFHIGYAADRPVETAEEARRILGNLLGVYGGHGDPACKDPARIIYGTTPDKVVWYGNVTNTVEELLNCYQEPEPVQEPKRKPRKAERPAPQRGAEADPDYLLSMVDVNALNYEEWTRCSAAYKQAGGSLDIWLDWCRGYTLGKKSAREQERENKATWKSLTGRDVTAGSLKYFAEQHSSDEYTAYMQALQPEKPKRKTKTRSTAQSEADSEAGSIPVQPIEEAQEQNRDPYNHDGTGKLTQANLEHALEHLGITVRFDVILHSIEVKGKILEKDYPADKLLTVLPMFLYDKLQHRLHGVTADKISAYLQNIAFSRRNTCNPILEKINATKWDGKDRLAELFEIMHLPEEDKLSRVLIRKWLMQGYCALHNDIDNPFSVDEVLVFVGEQGYGKTRLLEKLAINNRYFSDGASYDPRNKDSIMQLCTKWLVELGEIGSTMKKDVDLVKAFVSSPVDEYRAPYARSSIKYVRMTCFCGSTNDERFLIDETGNRRFLPVQLPKDKHIDIRGEKFRGFDTLQLWAQIQKLTEQELAAGATYASAFRLTREEQAELAERNETHTKPLNGEQEVADILSHCKTPEDGYELGTEYITATQFKVQHSALSKYSSSQIGKALRKLGYEPIRKKLEGTVVTVYVLPYKKYTANGYKSAL